MNAKKAAAYRQTVVVFIALALLTALEYWVSQTREGPPIPLLLIALVKAGLIVQYFMHIYRLWRAEDHS